MISAAGFIKIANIIGQLKQEYPPDGERVNIMVFGPPGMAKSSFIATLQWIFSDKVRPADLAQSSPVGSSSTNSFTQEWKWFRLPETNIYIGDSYGWEFSVEGTHNYTTNDLEKYLWGAVADRQKLTPKGGVTPTKQPNRDHAISSVIFFMPPSRDQVISLWVPVSIANTDRFTGGLKAFYDVASLHQVRITFALSKIDEVADCKQGYVGVLNNPNYKKSLGDIASLLPKKASISPLVTYQQFMLKNANRDTRDANIEEFALKLLEEALGSKEPVPVPLKYWNQDEQSKDEEVVVAKVL